MERIIIIYNSKNWFCNFSKIVFTIFKLIFQAGYEKFCNSQFKKKWLNPPQKRDMKSKVSVYMILTEDEKISLQLL